MDFKRIQTILLFGLLFGVGLLFLKMIQPYLFALFWAAVIASIFHPVYRRIQKKIKKENSSAVLTVMLAILIVILPLSGIFTLVVKQSFELYTAANNPETIIKLQNAVQLVLHNPSIQKFTGDIDIHERLRSFSSSATAFSIQLLKQGSQNTLQAIINTFIMLYALYYFLKDGNRWLRQLMHLLPLGDANEKILYQKFASTARATLKGTLFIGIIQGTVGGLFLAIVGIPGAAFWAVVMMVFSIIPAVGPAVVLVPSALYLLAIGHIWQGIVVIVGIALVGVLDNLLRPVLVGKDIQMHPMVILFSTLGGLGLFGISGVVVGPIIAAFFFAVVQMYETKYKKQLDSSST